MPEFEELIGGEDTMNAPVLGQGPPVRALEQVVKNQRRQDRVVQGPAIGMRSSLKLRDEAQLAHLG